MKKSVLFMALMMSICIWANNAENSVEVDFRVFSGKNFVEGLSIDDIQLFEEGQAQTIDSLYLVKNKDILSMEGLEKKPEIKRCFVFVFYLHHYLPRLDEIIDYFFSQVIAPGDTLTFLTPEKSYNFNERTLHRHSQKDIVKRIKKILIDEIDLGNLYYFRRLHRLNSILADLCRQDSSSNVQDIRSGLRKYTKVLGTIEKTRVIQQKIIIKFLREQNSKNRKKFAFIFYDREAKPDLNASELERFIEQYKDNTDVILELQNLFDVYRRQVAFDLKEIEERYAPINLLTNFVNYKITGGFSPAPGVDMREYSGDAIELFTTLVHFSGGMTEFSVNPVAFFSKAMAFSSQFYSLRYVSSNPGKDKKKITKIEIKIKDKNYKVYHPVGY